MTLPYAVSIRTRRRLHANTAWIEALTAHARTRRASRGPDDPPADLLDLLVDAREDDALAFTDLEAAQSISINLGNLYRVGGTGLAWLLAAHAAHDTARPDGIAREDWTGAVVKEVLRVYPAVTLTSRTLADDAAFGDVIVPAGTSVYLSPLLLHTDPRWWRADPGRFDPARWLAAEVHDPHAYLPYGAGPRRCTGDRLANAVLESAADLLADRRTTGSSGLPARRWGSVTQPRRLRISVASAG
ncbi:cytochrome P450 [Glycomyces sp. NPDC047010]|uniref:cytochrome P450 n=1 Tax=Glycomyces sp. NPDC047010 TaxID=3155023 RepID=UPI0033CCD6D2